MNDGWYFQRTDFADRLFHTLHKSQQRIMLSAARRMGKSLFLLKDFSAVAQTKGYTTLYVNLWRNPNAPQLECKQALILKVKDCQQAVSQSTTHNAYIKHTYTDNDLIGKPDITVAEKPTVADTATLRELEQLLIQLKSISGQPVLWVLDEIQHLATAIEFKNFAHWLKQQLQGLSAPFAYIMASSSRHHAHLLLQQTHSPFFHCAEPIELPVLGPDYIDFLIHRVHSHYHIQLTPITLQRAFQRLEYNPYWMSRMLHYLILQQCSITESLEHTLLLIELAEGYEQLAETLKPIDKLLFSALCEGQSPFNKELLEKIERETRVKGIPPNVQRSLKRLQEAQLISQLLKGEYSIEKPRFKRYLSASGNL